MGSRLKITGARRKRFGSRLISFFALAVVFCIDTGVDGILPIRTLVILVMLLGGFLVDREKRIAGRKEQLARETVEDLGSASLEELRGHYVLLRKRELRLEALLYLLFALLFALLLGLLRLADAKPLSWTLGLLFGEPAILLISLGLFSASVFKRRGPGEDRLYFPSANNSAEERKSDHKNEMRVIQCIRTASVPSHAELLRLLGPRYRQKSAVSRVAFGFFFVIPVLLSLFMIFFSLKTGIDKWIIVFAYFLLALCIPLTIYLLQVNNNAGSGAALKKLRSRSYSMVSDRIRRVRFSREDPQVMEVCFEKSGWYLVYRSGLLNGVDDPSELEDREVALLNMGQDYIPFMFIPANEGPAE